MKRKIGMVRSSATNNLTALCSDPDKIINNYEKISPNHSLSLTKTGISLVPKYYDNEKRLQEDATKLEEVKRYEAVRKVENLIDTLLTPRLASLSERLKKFDEERVSLDDTHRDHSNHCEKKACLSRSSSMFLLERHPEETMDKNTVPPLKVNNLSNEDETVTPKLNPEANKVSVSSLVNIGNSEDVLPSSKRNSWDNEKDWERCSRDCSVNVEPPSPIFLHIDEFVDLDNESTDIKEDENKSETCLNHVDESEVSEKKMKKIEVQPTNGRRKKKFSFRNFREYDCSDNGIEYIISEGYHCIQWTCRTSRNLPMSERKNNPKNLSSFKKLLKTV